MKPGPRRRLASGVLQAIVACGLWLSPAAAQQQADEPRLDPIFGRAKPREAEAAGPPAPLNDDEFDVAPNGRSAFDGFVGLFTFLTPQTTNLSIGVGPEYRPDYIGSDDYEVRANPQVYIKVRNFVFLSDDGADLALFGVSRFAIGPTLKVRRHRKEKRNENLEGLGDIDRTLEVGGFAAASLFDSLLVKAKIRKGVVGGHRGLVIDAQGTVLIYTSRRFSAAAAGQATWIDGNFADTYFSIDEGQSAASGLPIYNADAGFLDVGGRINGYINVGKRWSLNPYVQYRRIANDIGQSPIVDDLGSRDQFTVGMHLMREFQFDFK